MSYNCTKSKNIYMYLKGLLLLHKSKETSGHPQRINPIATSSGNGLADPQQKVVLISLNIYFKMNTT